MEIPKSVINNVGKIQLTLAALVSFVYKVKAEPGLTQAEFDKAAEHLALDLFSLWENAYNELQQVSSDLKEVYNRVTYGGK